MFQEYEKPAALESNGLKNTRPNGLTNENQFKRRIDMNYSTTNQNKFQQKSPHATGETYNPPKFRFTLKHIICDECARPLYLYGSNFIESYTAGQANVLRALCDRHAAELGGAE
jgi:hypothetical protein